MKKIILSVCAVIAAIMLSCDSNANAAGSSKKKYTKVLEINSMTVYKFDVKDNSGKNHEILICGTGWKDGGICMIELNTESK